MDFLVQPQDSLIGLTCGIDCPTLISCNPLCDRCGEKTPGGCTIDCPTYRCSSDGDICGIVSSPWSNNGLN